MSTPKPAAKIRRHKLPERHALSMSHGAYTNFFPKHIVQQINKSTFKEMMSVFDEIRLTKARLMQVIERREAWEAQHGDEMNAVPDAFPFSELWEETSDQGHKRTTKRVRPDFEAIEDRLVKRLSSLIELQNRIGRNAGISPNTAVRLRAKILDIGRKKNWTAVEIGTELDKRGLEIPYTLQQRIRAELTQTEPPEPMGGITDAEIDALARENERAAQLELDWLNQRRTELKTLRSGPDTDTPHHEDTAHV